jgi:Phosphorylase superfamily
VKGHHFIAVWISLAPRRRGLHLGNNYTRLVRHILLWDCTRTTFLLRLAEHHRWHLPSSAHCIDMRQIRTVLQNVLGADCSQSDMGRGCRIPTPTTCKTFSGNVGALEVHLAHNGKCDRFGVDTVGTNAATLTSYLAIAAFKPSVVISAGTAGGFAARGAKIGSVFVSTACVNHDRRIPLPGFEVFGTGREETHNVAKLTKALGTMLARCGCAL